jgi:hypothetical protein
MPLTNKYGLPAPLVAWLSNDTYQRRGDISATRLIAPVQAVVLEQRHREHIVEDAADRIWSALGSAVHSILEDTPGFDYLREYHMLVDVNGVKVSMTPDLYDMANERLWDYKVTSVWATKDGVKTEWMKQVNVYAYGLEQHGYPVGDAKVLAILRDWSKLEKLRNRDYPDVQAKVMDVYLDPVAAEEFLHESVGKWLKARELTDSQLSEQYPCTKQEMWAKDDKFAITKKGAKRAYRVLATRREAQMLMEEKGYDCSSHNLDHRIGEKTRCEHYCNVKPFCHQYNSF